MAGRRHAVPLRAGHGSAVDPCDRVWQSPAAEKRPVDEPCENRLRVCDPCPARLPAGTHTRRPVGITLWSMLGVAFFSWAFITSLGATQTVDAAGTIILLAARWSARGLCRTGRLAPRRSSSRRSDAFTRVSSVAELTRRWRRRKVNR